jgi:hypothetical protein
VPEPEGQRPHPCCQLDQTQCSLGVGAKIKKSENYFSLLGFVDYKWPQYMWAIFDRVSMCHKSDIKSRKPDSKIAWSSDPYRFPYLGDRGSGRNNSQRGYYIRCNSSNKALRRSIHQKRLSGCAAREDAGTILVPTFSPKMGSPREGLLSHHRQTKIASFLPRT